MNAVYHKMFKYKDSFKYIDECYISFSQDKLTTTFHERYEVKALLHIFYTGFFGRKTQTYFSVWKNTCLSGTINDTKLRVREYFERQIEEIKQFLTKNNIWKDIEKQGNEVLVSNSPFEHEKFILNVIEIAKAQQIKEK